MPTTKTHIWNAVTDPDITTTPIQTDIAAGFVYAADPQLIKFVDTPGLEQVEIYRIFLYNPA